MCKHHLHKCWTGNTGTINHGTHQCTLDFVYGPEHQRIKQIVTLSANAPSNMVGGTTWYLNDGGLSYEKEVKVNGITEYKHYLQAAG